MNTCNTSVSESVPIETLTSSTSEEAEVKRKGLRVAAKEFYPCSTLSCSVRENETPSSFTGVVSSYRDANSLLPPYPKSSDDAVLMSRVTVPDNVDETGMIDMLGNVSANATSERVAQPAYWSADGPRISMPHSYQFGMLTHTPSASAPLSSAQSDADGRWESSSTDSLDSEQVLWVEEQLRAGNPTSEGYFC